MTKLFLFYSWSFEKALDLVTHTCICLRIYDIPRLILVHIPWPFTLALILPPLIEVFLLVSSRLYKVYLYPRAKLLTFLYSKNIVNRIFRIM
jgi:hypothetical protein